MYVFINLIQRYNKFVNEIILYEESFIYLAFLPVFYIHCGHDRVCYVANYVVIHRQMPL